jgi:hypothetical protein
MERLMIQIPDRKSKLIKYLLKELGVVIEPNAFDLSIELNNMVKDGDKPDMDEIVAEIRAVRSKS